MVRVIALVGNELYIISIRLIYGAKIRHREAIAGGALQLYERLLLECYLKKTLYKYKYSLITQFVYNLFKLNLTYGN